MPSLRAYTYAARKYVRNNVLYLRREGTHLSKDGVVCDCYEVSIVRYLFLCRFWLFFEGLVPEEVLNEHTYVKKTSLSSLADEAASSSFVAILAQAILSSRDIGPQYFWGLSEERQLDH